MTAAADDHAAQRGDVAEVPSPGDDDVIGTHADIVGRVKVDPAEGWTKYGHPGVRSVRADIGCVGAGRRLCAEVTADVSCRQPPRTQTPDHDVGEILAYTLAGLERLDRGRTDGGAPGRVLEFAVNFVYHTVHGGEKQALGQKAIRGIVGERLLDPDVARLHAILACFQQVAQHRPAGEGERTAHRLPLFALIGFGRGRRSHLDARLGQHLEPIMRQVVFQAGHVIAKGVDVIAADGWLRHQGDGARMAGLAQRIAGGQMQQLMRMSDIAAVAVHGFVAHSIADGVAHAATVRVSMSMSEKCFSDSRSESRPAAVANVSICCASVSRARTARALSPSTAASSNCSTPATASSMLSSGLPPRDAAIRTNEYCIWFH